MISDQRGGRGRGGGRGQVRGPGAALCQQVQHDGRQANEQVGREEATAAIAATVLPKMTPPTSEELGMADKLYVILFSTYTPTHNRIRRK